MASVASFSNFVRRLNFDVVLITAKAKLGQNSQEFGSWVSNS
jgi:hypothetical protein